MDMRIDEANLVCPLDRCKSAADAVQIPVSVRKLSAIISHGHQSDGTGITGGSAAKYSA